VTLALGAAALELAGIGDARRKVEAALDGGAAAERFSRMVALLGSPADFVEHMDTYLAPAPVVRDVFAPAAGTVAGIDTRGIGMAVVALGGGRRLPSDSIDHAVGFDRLAGLGSRLDVQTPLARVHARDENAAAEAGRRLRAAYHVGDGAPPLPLIRDRLDPPERSL
jgi:thymidine phosphorylase